MNEFEIPFARVCVLKRGQKKNNKHFEKDSLGNEIQPKKWEKQIKSIKIYTEGMIRQRIKYLLSSKLSSFSLFLHLVFASKFFWAIWKQSSNICVSVNICMRLLEAGRFYPSVCVCVNSQRKTLA